MLGSDDGCRRHEYRQGGAGKPDYGQDRKYTIAGRDAVGPIQERHDDDGQADPDVVEAPERERTLVQPRWQERSSGVVPIPVTPS